MPFSGLCTRRLMLRRLAALGAAAAMGPPDPESIAQQLSFPASTLPGPLKFRGVDASFVPQLEALGVAFRTSTGVVQDPLAILKTAGANCLRLRVWVNPSDGWCSKARTLAMATRAKALGLSTIIDFHYSDSWADPGQQTPPAAWVGLTSVQLAQRVYDHTRDVVSALNAQGTPPGIVQIGNEITDGMLWPTGRLSSGGLTNLVAFLNAGRAAVRDAAVGRPARVMIHLDRGGDNATCRWFFDQILGAGVAFDVIGLSYYPWWHGSLASMAANLQDLATRYQKPLWIVETAYPWTLSFKDSQNNFVWQSSQLQPGYSASVNGQRNFLLAVQDALASLPGGLGEGVCYWAPEYIAAPGFGSPWENLALFDFNNRLVTSASALAGRARDARRRLGG